jgi:periplasmic divalent cation tolerance protein
MPEEYIAVMITLPGRESARSIAQTLLAKRLIACANILGPVNSLYHWQGKLYDEEEVLMICKTRAALFEAELVPAVKALHPYEVPEIIAVPLQAGLPAYLAWIREETT